MVLTDLALALRRELEGQDRPREGWEAVADGALLALLHRGDKDGCCWDALIPHLTGHHTYMTTAQGHPAELEKLPQCRRRGPRASAGRRGRGRHSLR